MKRIIMLILLVTCLTACLSKEKTVPSSEVVAQTEVILESSDTSTKKSMDNTAPTSEVSAQAKKILESTDTSNIESEDSIYLTKQLGTVPDLTEVKADEFPFADMKYISLVEKGGPLDLEDGATMYHEYALLGGEWDTYEKGRECYETINSLYEGTPTNLDDTQTRRHISCFSNDGERVLVKDYSKWVGFGDHVIYELYEGFTPVGAYIYYDIFGLVDVNYTKSLQFINLDYSSAGFSSIGGDGTVLDFYKTSQLSSRDKIDDAIDRREVYLRDPEAVMIDVTNPEIYKISRVTDPADTVYYREDSDEEGKQCIGIYSVSDNRLIYQSKAVEQGIEIEEELQTISLLDENIIVGVTASDTNRTKFEKEGHGYSYYIFDYYAIDIKSNEWIYLFTNIRGDFSPDGKYFSGGTWINQSMGYQIMSMDSGTYVNITINIPFEEIRGYRTRNIATCWVKKDKIEDLKKIAEN